MDEITASLGRLRQYTAELRDVASVLRIRERRNRTVALCFGIEVEAAALQKRLERIISSVVEIAQPKRRGG